MNIDSSLIYIEKNQNLVIENKAPYVKRAIHSRLSSRNYNLIDILKFSFTKDAAPLKDHEISLIIEKSAKKLKTDPQVMHDLYLLTKQNFDSDTFKSKLNVISQLYLSDSKNLATLQTLKKVFNKQSELGQTIHSLVEELNVKNKWKDLGLDIEILKSHYSDAEFLVKTRLIYSIVGLIHTSSVGAVNHEIKQGFDDNGQPGLFIKKQNEWVPVKQIQTELEWDKIEKMLASKSNPDERWNYFEEGLVPIDRFYHHEVAHKPTYPSQNAKLHPVAKITPDEMATLVEHAKTFNGFSDPKYLKDFDKKNCVVQIVTHPRPFSNAKILKNLTAQVPVHCDIHIIKSDGTVYSTGFGSTLFEDTFNQGRRKFLGTINGQPTIMDYEDMRPHQGRVVTNIPTGEAEIEKILNHLNECRKNSIRFNIFKQNCMRLGTSILSMVGVNLDLTVPLQRVLYRALPSIGTEGISKRLILPQRKILPECVKKAFRLLAAIVFYIPHKIHVLFNNLLILTFGGRISSPIKTKNENDRTDEAEGDDFEEFRHLCLNLFDEKAADIQHSSVMINWQLQQASTVVHQYTGKPSMNILPPTDEAAQAYSKQRILELADLYQHSTPYIDKRAP